MKSDYPRERTKMGDESFAADREEDHRPDPGSGGAEKEKETLAGEVARKDGR